MSDINASLAKLMGIPPDSLSATLRLRPGKAPTVTITKLVNMKMEVVNQKFVLVPIEAKK